MLDVIKRNAWVYALELLIACVILSFSLNAFLIYAFMSIVLKFDTSVDYIRKLIRVVQFQNEIKLLSIVKKMKIGEEELTETFREIKEKTPENHWSIFEKEYAEITKY